MYNYVNALLVKVFFFVQCGVAVEDQERNDLVQMTLQVRLCRLCWLNYFECSGIREFYRHNRK